MEPKLGLKQASASFSVVVSGDTRLWGLPYQSHECLKKRFWERLWRPDLSRDEGAGPKHAGATGFGLYH